MHAKSAAQRAEIVKGSKVVVGHGRRDHRRPVARLCAPKDPLVAAKSMGKHLHDHKKQGVKGLEEVLEGSEGAYKQVCARQREGLVRGNTWLWFGERGCSA